MVFVKGWLLGTVDITPSLISWEYFFIGIFEGVSIALGFMELHVRRDPALSAFVVLGGTCVASCPAWEPVFTEKMGV